MLFGLLAPRFELYSVYALWFTRSQTLAIFCLCSLIYLLPDFSYNLFMLFGLLAPRFWLYSVYAPLVYLLPDFSYYLIMLFGLHAPRF
jgi:hypothetical protein